MVFILPNKSITSGFLFRLRALHTLVSCLVVLVHSVASFAFRSYMEDLSDRICRVKENVGKLTGYVCQNKARLAQLEDHFKKLEVRMILKVEESLQQWQSKWEIHMEGYVERFGRWHRALDKSIGDSRSFMEAEVDKLKLDDQKCWEKTTKLVELENEKLNSLGQRLEAEVLAHVTGLSAKLQALDDKIQESNEVLQDIKHREQHARKWLTQNKERGPLERVLLERSPPDLAELRCRARSAYRASEDRARERSLSQEDARLRRVIAYAQDVASVNRGRSASERRAAQLRCSSRDIENAQDLATIRRGLTPSERDAAARRTASRDHCLSNSL